MAVDATGTPTSPDSIPKYATSTDAPSGRGFNAAMDAIQTALSGRWLKTLFTTTGDIAYASAVSTPARLAIGSTGNVLTVAGGLPTWAAPASTTTYRKTTSKTVNTTVAATDLLNGEITIAANVMGATGSLRFTAWGDWLNNSGGTVAPPRFQLKLGATTIIDTGAGGGVVTGATRQSWELNASILNSATNAQIVKLFAYLNSLSNTAGVLPFTTGNGQVWESGNLIQMQGVNTGLAVDTTVANALVLNVINASASATYETKLFGALIEVF